MTERAQGIAIWHGAAEEDAVVVAAFEVVHLAGSASGDPCGEALGVEVVGRRLDRRARCLRCRSRLRGPARAATAEARESM